MFTKKFYNPFIYAFSSTNRYWNFNAKYQQIKLVYVLLVGHRSNINGSRLINPTLAQ